MTADERKWTALLLFVVAFVLAIPALVGVADVWLYAMRLSPIRTWDASEPLAAYLSLCFAAVTIFVALAAWPKS